ncbi:MAG TPA: DNA-processing protein DprA [Thermoanaerobaculaceae bacterium]|nr:DNA-processing protein DprA [Thermoanaerobaculaceae bacterium]HRS15203.1 DNA-processing protein DprA [Thermoanaerobaculaceae bacterium]
MPGSIPSSQRALAWVAHQPDGARPGRDKCRAWLCGQEPDPAGAERMLERVPAMLAELAARGWRWLAAGDPEFPAPLAELSDPPLGLFMRGTVPPGPGVAIVGARRASAYGREVAEWFGGELARAGVTVVSGMARGVDAAAHRGALAAGGPTVAVWGCGPDRVYPPEHAELAEQIAAHGALVTEYPPGSPPLAHHFPERNRIIAGLARVVVVVEAEARSGALITARLALDEGREVLAVPGSVFSPLSAGPNGLLRAGAAPALTATDVLDVLGIAAPASAREPLLDGLLAAFRPGEAMTVDALAAASSMPVAAVLEALLHLELEGAVAREPDGRYRRVRRRATP